jgi:hypothetical protein
LNKVYNIGTMTSMESMLHTYLVRLRIIAKIPARGRLDTTQNDLNIYYDNIVNWIWRKFQGDGKEHAVKYLIDLYREINSFSDQLMYNTSIETVDVRRRKKISLLVSLTEKLKESLTGIRHLIGTYKDYLKIVSLLECIEQDIVIPQYNILLKFIPYEYHTEILKTEISHSHAFSGFPVQRDRSVSETDITTMNLQMPETPERSMNNISDPCIRENSNKSNIFDLNVKSDPINIPTKKKKGFDAHSK